MKFKYGDHKIELPLKNNNIISVIEAKKLPKIDKPKDKLFHLLENPIGSSSLTDLIKKKKAHKILIIVNDITRPTPYHVILPPLLEQLDQIGIKKENITFIVATGAHRGNTKEENEKIFGEELTSSYRFVNHDCDDNHLIDLGAMKSGNHLWVDPILKQIDFIITTGVIVPHYFAGFSGGRKSFLPGISGRETIEKNHSNMVHPKAFTGSLIGNPVNEEMIESAQRVGVDFGIFNINVVTDEHYDIVDIVAGDIKLSWDEGVKICRETYFSPIKGRADVVFVSAGGYPKDINVYQSQKALENAYQAVNQGGTIVLIAECRESLGNSTFENWIEEATSIEDIESRLKKRFVLGGHKAYAVARVAKNVEIVLISSLNEEKVRKLFMKPMKNINLAIDYIKQKYGNNFKAYLIPSGGIVVPQIEAK